MVYSANVFFGSTNKLLFSETPQRQYQFMQAYSPISGYIICTVYKAKAYHFVVTFWALLSLVTNRTTIWKQLTEWRSTYTKNVTYIFLWFSEFVISVFIICNYGSAKGLSRANVASNEHCKCNTSLGKRFYVPTTAIRFDLYILVSLKLLQLQKPILKNVLIMIT